MNDEDIKVDDGFSSGSFEVAALSGRQTAAAVMHDVKPIAG